MLAKALVHGLVAAVIVGSTATVYARIKGNHTLFPESIAANTVAGQADANAALVTAMNDDRRPAGVEARHDDRDRKRSFHSDRHRDRHDRKRDHDDDDD